MFPYIHPSNPTMSKKVWFSMRTRDVYHLTVLIHLVLFLPRIGEAQTLRSFPPLFNVAKQQPLLTSPSQSTCGIPTRSAYCVSTTSPASVNTCLQAFCVQECPRRLSLPVASTLLIATGYGACVTQDTINVRPPSAHIPALTDNHFSAVFSSGSLCFLTPLESPELGANGAFTVAYWMWQSPGNSGTVLEKQTSQGALIFRVSASGEGVTFLYTSQFGERSLEFPDTIAPETWSFIAVQVYDLTVSVFINGTGPGFDPSGTRGLIGQVMDGQGAYRIGQSNDGSHQFTGRLQDVQFFSEALTNREIQEVYTGILPDVRIDSECRCPPSHPRVKPQDTRYCIRNGVPDNLGDDILRLNNDSHPLEYMNDGDSTSVWVSSFLHDVIIQVDLQDQFQVFYVVLQLYSPGPHTVTMERLIDDEWLPWQHYASDCDITLGLPNNGPLSSPDSVNCLQFETNGLEVPHSNGNITFNILSPEPVARPGHDDFYNSPALIEFVKARQIRLRLRGRYYTTHALHDYYGIYELIVTGRCNCHGHASVCDTSTRPYTCACAEESHTQGAKCERCLPLYNDKPFRLGDQLHAHPCKPCQCYGHADSCFYNASADPFPQEHDLGGGGTCIDCQHNTHGRMCDTCRDFYFREEGASLFSEDVCQRCGCSTAGVNGSSLLCEKVGGQCSCKEHVSGRQCDICEDGFFNLQSSNPIGCESCDCHVSGTENGDVTCHEMVGQCNCKRNVRGLQCDACDFGFYNLTMDNPTGCSPCECNPFGSSDPYCDPVSGQCVCKEHVQGRACDRCAVGFADFSQGCVECGCDPRGTEPDTVCDIHSGQCQCKPHATGLKCDQCQDGYYNLGGDALNGCVFCSCDEAGTMESSSRCDKDSGECTCKEHVQGRTCNTCIHNTYNLTTADPRGCAPCDCDPTGTLSGDQLPVGELACDHNTGQCTCLAGRLGAKCDRCTLGTYLSSVPGGGCLDCDCDVIGSIQGTTCDPGTGQCQCYGSGSGITGRRCDSCEEYYFNLHISSNGPRCEECACDVSGSVNDTCSAVSGQCECKDFTTGRQCGQCVDGASGLSANNPFGCSKSPSQQPAPSHIPLDPHTLQLLWGPPDYPNGVITAYYVWRDGERVGEVLNPLDESDLVFNDTGLTPFTEYSYQIEAENDFGSTLSPSLTYRTPSGSPSGEINLSLATVAARMATFVWQRPSSANGVIQRYVLLSRNHRDTTLQQHYQGLDFEATVEELTPYTEYHFLLRACTSGGCLESESVQVITRQAAPEGQTPPTAIALSPTQLFVSWEPPEYPNGVIIFYELWIRGMPASAEDGISRNPEEQRIFHPAGQYDPLLHDNALATVVPSNEAPSLPPPSTNVTVEALDGYTLYEFRVISENALGKAASTWIVARTAEDVPEEMPTPHVEIVSSSSLNITWPEPTEMQSRGAVTSFHVYHYAATDLTINPFAPPFMWILVGTVAPPTRHLLVAHLPAYTNQTLRVELCNSVGCLNSSDVTAQTLASAPEGVHPPLVSGQNASTMAVSWTPPEVLNGPAPVYTVRRTAGAFNNPPPRVSRGTRFNGQGYYKFPPDTVPQGVAFTGIDLWFKTTQREGLILFAASEGGQEEFIALQLRSGRPWFLFDPQVCAVALTVDVPSNFTLVTDDNGTLADDNGTFADGMWHHLVAERHDTHACLIIDGTFTGCSIIVTTTDDEGLPYNDNTWHHLEAMRQGQYGTIRMDDRWTGQKVTDCSTGNIIGDNTGVYVGGLPQDYIIQRQEADPRAQVITTDYQGCLRDVRVLTTTIPAEEWTDLYWEGAVERQGALANWEGCPDDLEPAYHFLGTGYVVFQSGVFIGGGTIDFSFDMRTELQSGLLFFAYGGSEVYWLVQLQDGGVYAEYGVVGFTQALFFPNESVSICDGNWHKIRVQQFGEQLTITVDNVYSRRTGDRVQLASPIVIASHLHIGGVERDADTQLFLDTHGLTPRIQGRFGGCLKSIRVNRRPYSIEENAVTIVTVNMDGCPALVPSREPCKVTLTEVIYQGPGNMTYDYDQLAFTEYLYQVEARNEAGSAVSDWTTGRTREGAPWGVHGPTTVTVVDGFSMHVEWQEPEGRTGILQSFVVTAYNRDLPETLPIEAQFNQTTFAGTVSGLLAFTNYSVHIVACTNGGCTQSDNSSLVATIEEAPQHVQMPVAIETGAFYLLLIWDPPTFPNGVLTGYVLYMEDTPIYSGFETQFNVTGLHVYTAYRFHLTVCSRVGCSNSSMAHLVTAQLPPTHVDPPILIVLGTSRIMAEWQTPDELNGALERYILYTSVVQGVLGTSVYNSSDLFTSYTIANLNAGTTFHITLAACTGGGCRLSQATSARTEESAPEGVFEPEVTSPTPDVLHVIWQPPQYPNGIITLYRLYHNGLMVFNTSTMYEHTIDGLLPWSLHSLRLEACTAQGCSSSDTVQVRTKEAAPEGSIGLDVRVPGPRTVTAQWNEVEVENGLVYYTVYVEGLYYVDIENWNYNTVTERRALYETTNSSGEWVDIAGLIPYSIYYIQVNASNTQGYVLSNIKQANMPIGAPDGVKAPQLSSPASNAVRATWEPVGRANADQEPAFQLQFRNLTSGLVQNLFEQPTTSSTFLQADLKPFTTYEFRLVAINSYGHTNSQWASITTMQDKPSSIDPPMTSDVNTRSVDVTWEPPYRPNGIITTYVLYQDSDNVGEFANNVTRTRVGGLTPHTTYTFTVEVCTLAGCTVSQPSQPVTTLPAVPEGVAAPILISPSPTSVLITWSPPTLPNGAILQYIIERRLSGSDAIILVMTFLPDDVMEYVDDDVAIAPYVMYEYRIGAESTQGVGYSDWAEVTTRPSRPGGVLPPTVETLSPTSILVRWEEPIQLNGRLESYILRLPNPRFEIFNTSVQSMVVEDLTPHTEYRITITACTDGGCSESTPTVITTSPWLPDHVTPPIATTHSQSYISLLWQPPGQPNGPNIRYELARTKIRQPLIPDSAGFGVWTSIYSGLDTYYEDRGLTMYTTYRYRLTVYNDFGHTSSEPSDEVTTFGGVPRRAADVAAYSVNHTAIEVRWQIPDVLELQGGVSEFLLNVTSNTTSMTFTLPASAIDHVLGDLDPNTRYVALLTLVTHGGERITSEPAYATTSDGAPEGFDAPRLFVLNDTALQVAWLPPREPNGHVADYFLYVDGQRMNVGGAETRSFILASLQPYTIYAIQIEVCTEFACLKSDVTQGSTAESVAAGLLPPTVLVLSPYALNITWREPARPNGIILRYELYRKTLAPCEQPEPEEPPGLCTYLECGVQESFCGTQCYSGPRTCCDGVVHDNVPGYECCGSHYIPARTDPPNELCCGGLFYYRLDNYQCCGGRYVEVLPGEVCCADPHEDRVDIGRGDQCCGGVPYVTNGSQICCNGELEPAYGQQCCGGQVVDDVTVCCGDVTKGTSFTADVSKTCCGEDYVTSATTVCCMDEAGRAKAHEYESAEALTSANEKCCGREQVSSALACCHDSGYNPLTQSCADRSEIDSDCGSGVICPLTNGDTSAMCNRCNFDRTTHRCGSYSSNPSSNPVVTMETSRVEELEESGGLCLTDPKKIYTGEDLVYIEEELEPYTEYQYSVVAVNGAGSSHSDVTVGVTDQALPEGVHPPDAAVHEGRLDIIYLTWQQPDRPNGEILWYVLTRDRLEILRDAHAQSYTDDNVIQPYRTYTYRLSVCNIRGCVASEEVRVATLQAAPEGVEAVTIETLSPHSLLVTWSPPSQPNGLITGFQLWETSMGLLANLNGDVFEFTADGLEPYGLYEFTLTACTEAGCTNSSETSDRTLEDRPQGVEKPSVIVVNSSVLEIIWRYPESPNGIIVSNLLYRSRDFTGFEIVYNGDSDDLYYRDSDIQADTLYQYRVQIATSAGGTNSSISTVQVPISSPGSIPPAYNVTALSAYHIYVAWDPPQDANGEIDQYIILINAGQEDEVEIGVGLVLSESIYGLKPYTIYEVRIQACLAEIDNGCGTGPAVSVRTLEAPPENQPKPDLVAKSASSVEITWQPPGNPNGVITQYRIYRRSFGEDGNGIIINSLSGNIRTFTNAGSDLQPYTDYEYRIITVNNEGEAESSWSTVRTLEATPENLEVPLIEHVGAHGVTLTWQPPLATNGVIQTYDILYQLISEDPTAIPPIQTVTVASRITQASISGLSPYTTYQFRIRAHNSVGSVTSSGIQTTTGQSSPAMLYDFDVEKISNGLSVILRWQEPNKPNGVISTYRIYEVGNLNAVYQGLHREFEYRRLQPYTEYTLQLEVCTTGGCALSRPQSLTTAEIPPENQPAPTLSPGSGSQVRIQWQPPVSSHGKILYFEVVRRSEPRRSKRQLSEPEVVYRTEDTNAESYEFVDSDLDPFTNYEYQIRAGNSMGVASSPWQRIETPQGAPSGMQPPVVTHAGIQYDRLRIQWFEPNRANGLIQGYRLQRNDSIPWSFGPNDEKSYLDTGLIAFTVYSYAITVCTAGGCTTSESAEMRTPEAPPYFVTSPTATTINSTAIHVTWQAPQITNGEIIGYSLYMDGQIVHSGLELEYTVGSLIPYTAYMFRISACTSGGCEESSAVIGRPDEAGPQGLRAPVLQVRGSRSIEITWSVPEYPNGIITSYELERDGALIQRTQTLQFIDYTVEPGTTYVYTVTSINSKGSVTSPPASATTYASAPGYIDPPLLLPISSSSIRVTWSEPLSPNGEIYNYTLYQNNVLVFSSFAFIYTAIDLLPFTEYSFKVEACTSHGCTMSDSAHARTLQAPPTDMAAPEVNQLADADGAHRGVFVSWREPRRPNGVVTRYELYRKNSTGLALENYAGSRKLLYSGMELVYTDLDLELLPFTVYEYMVACYNAEGHVFSEWKVVRTLEAPPEGVPAPFILQDEITATTIDIEILEPAVPNGNILYNLLHVNGTVIMAGSRSHLVLGDPVRHPTLDMSPLTPHTIYSLSLEACTSGGCGRGPVVMVTTKSDVPRGLSPPSIVEIHTRSVRISWLPPTQPNGPDLQYEMHLRRGCPYPYANSDDVIEIDCLEDTWQPLLTNRGDFELTVDELIPYMTYDIRLRVCNSGAVDCAESTSTFITKPTTPEYNTELPPTVVQSGTVLIIEWTSSFFINGEVQHFTLQADGVEAYRGMRTRYSFFRESYHSVYEFQVSVVTEYGEAVSEVIVFDPTLLDGFVSTERPKSSKSSKDDTEVYEEVWFIVLLAVIVLAILFVVLVLCLCRARKPANVRERAPLDSRGTSEGGKMAALGLCVDPYDGSIVTTEIPAGAVIQHSPGGVAASRGGYPGYVNPAYSPQPSAASDPPSLRGRKWQDEDLDSLLDGYMGNDSGLHSLANGEEYEVDSNGQPVSVLREHMLFPDTHL